MIGYSVPIFVFIGAGIALTSLQSKHEPWEMRYLWISLIAHFLAAAAIIGVNAYLYGQGDMLVYQEHGEIMAEYVASDPVFIGKRMFSLLLHGEEWDLVPHGAGGPTGSMFATSGFLNFFLGKSLYAVCTLIAALAFFGKLAMYRVFRAELDRRIWKPMIIATMLVPSVIFWSSGLLKEAVCMPFLGAMLWGAHKFVASNRRALGAGLLVIGTYGVSLYKPYILIPFILAAALWAYWRRVKMKGRTIRIRPVPLVIVGAIASVMLVFIGNQFPRYDVGGLSEQLVAEQEVGMSVEGGSNIEIADGAHGSIFSQATVAPWALITAFFRPVVFESTNPQMFVNGIEMLVIFVLFMRALRRRGVRGSIRQILSSPTLMFCASFAFAMGLGVGLASTNLGTLSRYRMPMIPFFVATVTVLGMAPERRRREYELPENLPERRRPLASPAPTTFG